MTKYKEVITTIIIILLASTVIPYACISGIDNVVLKRKYIRYCDPMLYVDYNAAVATAPNGDTIDEIVCSDWEGNKRKFLIRRR